MRTSYLGFDILVSQDREGSFECGIFERDDLIDYDRGYETPECAERGAKRLIDSWLFDQHAGEFELGSNGEPEMPMDRRVQKAMDELHDRL